MNIVINYDFFNAIKDAREPYGPFKIVRNRQKLYTNIILPMTIGFNLGMPVTHIIKSYCGTTLFLISFETLFDFMFSAANKSEIDMFKDDANSKLQVLLPRLHDINVKTDYDKLLESQLYARKYKVQLNEDKIPSLIEKKFVLVPSYNFGGEETETSIMQEHVVGSHEYVLSVDEYKQEKRRVLVPNNS